MLYGHADCKPKAQHAPTMLPSLFLKNHLVHNFLWKICSDVHPKLAQNLDFSELKFHSNSLQLFTHLKH